MNLRARRIRQRAGDHQAGKPAAGAEIGPDPRLGRQSEKLQRIGDMARPELGSVDGAIRVDALLPVEQQIDEAVEPLRCFT